MAVTTAFLAEFVSDGKWGLLSALAPAPLRQPLPTGRTPADVYRPLSLGWPPGLVLVHGLAPEGKDDPRLRQAAQLLARTGFRVAVPTIPGLTRLRLRPEDAEPVVAAIQALAREHPSSRITVFGVSVGAGPALLAAADSRVVDRVGAVLSLGGYASAVELLRYFLTGAYAYDVVAGRVPPQPHAARLFLRANLDLLKNAEDRRLLETWLADPRRTPARGLSAEGRAVVRLVENRDPAQLDRLVQALPDRLRELLVRLSPERVVPHISARLFVLHGRRDPAVPFTESLRLADAARGQPGVRLVVVEVLAHVEPGEAAPGWGRTLVELWRLWALAFEVLGQSSRPISR